MKRSKQSSILVTVMALGMTVGGAVLGANVPEFSGETTTTFHIILAHPIEGQTTTTEVIDPTASTVTVTNPDGSTSPAPSSTSSSPNTIPPTTIPLLIDAGAEQIIAASTDQVRVSVGLSPVTTDSGLHAYARAWASHMAETGVFAHSDIAVLLSEGWEVVGENLAQGIDATAVMQALIDSPAHLDIIVDPLFTSDGVGVVVDAEGELWVVQVFAGEELDIPTTTTLTIPVETTLPTITTPTLPDVTTTIVSIP